MEAISPSRCHTLYVELMQQRALVKSHKPMPRCNHTLCFLPSGSTIVYVICSMTCLPPDPIGSHGTVPTPYIGMQTGSAP